MIRQINAVYAAIENRGEREQVIDSLGEIYGSIAAHFALEEQLMLRHRYERYAEHRADHNRLLDDIRDIAEAFERTVALDDAGLRRRLTDWFQQHFKTHDSRLHKMSGMRAHEPVSQSTLRGMIRHAKNRLLGRTDARR